MSETISQSGKGRIDPSLLSILCCPETKLPLTLIDEAQLASINQRIDEGLLKNKGGSPVREKLDGGLLRSDKNLIYPIRENIPIMLIEEGIPLGQPS